MSNYPQTFFVEVCGDIALEEIDIEVSEGAMKEVVG
jgi:hypothetical protein